MTNKRTIDIKHLEDKMGETPFSGTEKSVEIEGKDATGETIIYIIQNANAAVAAALRTMSLGDMVLDDSSIAEVAIGAIDGMSRRLVIVARANAQRIDENVEDIRRQMEVDSWVDENLDDLDIPFGLHPDAVKDIKVDIARYRDAVKIPLPEEADDTVILQRANRAALLYLTEQLDAGNTFTSASAADALLQVPEVKRAVKECSIFIDAFTGQLVEGVLRDQKGYIAYVELDTANEDLPPVEDDRLFGWKKLQSWWKNRKQ